MLYLIRRVMLEGTGKKVRFGGLLILIGVAVMLLDWFLGRRSNKGDRKGEIKFGNISVKGGFGFLIFVFGILVYVIEEGFVNLR